MIVIASNDDYAGLYSRVVYEAEADQVLYALVQGDHTGTYALSLSRTPIPKIGVVPESVDFGEVAVGGSVRRTVVVQNLGVAPLDVGDVQLAGAGLLDRARRRRRHRDPRGRVPRDRGGLRAHAWHARARRRRSSTTGRAWSSQYRYSGGVLIGVLALLGLPEHGRSRRSRLAGEDRRAGDDRDPAPSSPAAATSSRVAVSKGLELRAGRAARAGDRLPSTFTNSLGGLSGRRLHSVARRELVDREQRRRRARRSTSTCSASPCPPALDTTPPTTTDDYDGQWHNGVLTVHLAASDNAGGSGMVGGLAKTEYSKDGGKTWVTGDEVIYAYWRRRGGEGVYPCSTAPPTPPATSRRRGVARSGSTPGRPSRPATHPSLRRPATSPCTSRPATAPSATPTARASERPGTPSTAKLAAGVLGPRLGHRPPLDRLLLGRQRGQRRDAALVQRDDPRQRPGEASDAVSGAAARRAPGRRKE